MMLRLGKRKPVDFVVGRAGRDLGYAERPRYGFNWWFWKPSFSYNNRGQVFDAKLNFLCFWFGFTRWGNN